MSAPFLHSTYTSLEEDNMTTYPKVVCLDSRLCQGSTCQGAIGLRLVNGISYTVQGKVIATYNQSLFIQSRALIACIQCHWTRIVRLTYCRVSPVQISRADKMQARISQIPRPLLTLKYSQADTRTTHSQTRTPLLSNSIEGMPIPLTIWASSMDTSLQWSMQIWYSRLDE